MYILSLSAIGTLCVVFGIISLRMSAIARGTFARGDREGGLGLLYISLRSVYKTFSGRARLLGKLAMQYVLHILVRTLFYVQEGVYRLYAWSRNTFMKNAVKSKASVSFFWSHLKEYKSEIEKERTTEE
jgi:hypothetical protein